MDERLCTNHKTHIQVLAYTIQISLTKYDHKSIFCSRPVPSRSYSYIHNWSKTLII